MTAMLSMTALADWKYDGNGKWWDNGDGYCEFYFLDENGYVLTDQESPNNIPGIQLS